MVTKNRKIILPIGLMAFLIGIGAFVILRDTKTKTSVKVLDRDFSICTADVPSSSCGPYEVSVRSLNGQKTTYKVTGFDNGDSEQYYKISSKLTEAKEHNKTVELEVNSQGEITAVR